ncbi:MAG: sensor histidine kinase [Chthoniobacterales bacterium]
MNWRSLRARLALWTVAVVSGALILFGAGAALALREKLLANVDNQIRYEARDFFDELGEQHPDWNDRHSIEAFLAEETTRFEFVEVHDATGRLLYRSPRLGEQEIWRENSTGQTYTLVADGRSIRVGLFANGGAEFALGKDLRELNKTLASLIESYLLTLPLVAIAVGAGGWWIARRAAAPVETIAASAARISASDLAQRIPVPDSNDEIAQLALVLNTMFERLQRSFEQITRFTSDASHELKTPLTLMRAQLESALDPAASPVQRETISDLIEQSSQLSQIIDGLLFLSRADDRMLALEQQPVDLVELLEDLREDAEILATRQNLGLEFKLPPKIVVSGDARFLRRAVMNLLDNAIKYNRMDGSVAVSGSTNGQRGVLTFRNTGPGVPAALHRKIFERFYRNDNSREGEISGHGLGLSIAREIVRAHRGEIVLVRSDHEWTEFSVVLPVSAKTSAQV